MFKRLLMTTTLLFSLSLADEPLKIGIEGAYPPFSYVTPDRSLAGFEVDLANLFCEKMERECLIVQTDFDALIPSLNSKRIDAILASMSITDVRKEAIDFSNKYYQTPARFTVPKGSKIEISEEGLKGKVIGVQSGTIHETYMNDNFKKIATIRSYRNLDDGMFDLDSGRIDLIFADVVAVDTGYLQKEYGETLEFIGPEFTDERWFGEGVGVGIRKGENELREAFNRAILESREDKSYHEIQEKHFGYDVYGAE